MYKWITLLMVLLAVFEPALGLLELYGISREIALTCAMSLALTPVVVAQFDNH
jgi:hypothetical protein